MIFIKNYLFLTSCIQYQKNILNSPIFSLCKTAFAVISACLRRHQTAVVAKAAPVGQEMRTALIHGQN